MGWLKKMVSQVCSNPKQSYSSYDQYLAHQKEKTLDPARRERWLGEEWEEKCAAFRQAFSAHQSILRRGGQAACLGARTGQEVQVLRDVGVQAMGYDLVAHPPLVQEADFHQLPLADNSLDLVFSNAYDHCLYPEKFIAQIERVLKPGGHALLHLQVGKPIREGSYDVTYVGKSADVLRHFQKVEVLVDRQIPECLGMTWEVLVRKVD